MGEVPACAKDRLMQRSVSVPVIEGLRFLRLTISFFLPFSPPLLPPSLSPLTSAQASLCDPAILLPPSPNVCLSGTATSSLPPPICGPTWRSCLARWSDFLCCRTLSTSTWISLRHSSALFSPSWVMLLLRWFSPSLLCWFALASARISSHCARAF